MKITTLTLTAVMYALAVITAHAYDFTATDTNGNTLYYTITDSSNNYVGVTNDGTSGKSAYGSLTSGAVVIPSTVTNDGTTYTVTSIESSAFGNSSSGSQSTAITSVTIPETVTTIGSYAFSRCSGITSVTFDGTPTVTTLETYAFYNCTALKSFTCPNSVTSLGTYCFANDGSLTSFTLPENEEFTTIPSRCFAACSSLTSMVIPKSVTTISNRAFSYAKSGGVGENLTDSSPCVALATVTFEDGSQLTSIGNEAFRGCTLLSTLDLPEKVETIGSATFYGCTALTSFTLPGNVSSVGLYAFVGCSGLTSITCQSLTPPTMTDASSYSYTDYFDSDVYSSATLYVPSGTTDTYAAADYWDKFTTTTALAYELTSDGLYYEIIDSDNNYVKVININGESYNTYTGDIVIPETITVGGTTYTVTAIGSSAFRESSTSTKGLTSISIPSTVTEIGHNAFTRCTALTSVTIPSSVTTICGEAFYYCSAITTLTIEGEGLNEVGDSAFMYCKEVTKIEMPSSVTSLGTLCFGFCYKIESLTLPTNSKFTEIPSKCCYCCSTLSSISIPEQVTSIGDYAFGGSGTSLYVPLTSVTIPDAVTSIGSYAFAYNAALTSVTIPDAVTSIGSYAFRSCYALTSITFPSNSQFTEIPTYCCYLCSCLTAIDIPESVTTIGQLAFAGGASTTAPQLSKLTIPMNVTSIGKDAFKYCPASYIICEATEPPSLSSAFSTTTTPIYVPTGCASSYQSADNWSKNSDYISEYMPVESKYYTITTATYDSSTNTATREVEITHDGSGNYCTYSGDAIIPSTISPDKTYTVTAIGEHAFSGSSSEASSLTAVTIPNTVTTIGDYAFGACSSLKSVTIPASVTSLGTMAFSAYATSFATIYCTSLASVTFEDESQLTTIGTSAFRGASALTSVTLPNSVTSIGNNAFYNCTRLTSFTFPENDEFTEIPTYCLGNCFALTSITIPASVTSIGQSAFYCYDTSGSTSSLSKLTFESGSNLTSIGNCAFQYNVSLTSVTLPNTVTTVGSSAFAGCTSLETVRLSNGLTSLGDKAFSNCSALTSVYARNKNPQTIASTTFDATEEDSETFSATLYVPKNWADTYSSVNYWSYFSDPTEYEEEFYLTGDFNNWAENDTDYQFKYDDYDYAYTTTSGSTELKTVAEYYYVVVKASDIGSDKGFKIISDLGELSYNGTVVPSTFTSDGKGSGSESSTYSLSLLDSSSTTTAAARSSIKSISSDDATYLSLGDSDDEYVVLHIYEKAADTWRLVVKTASDSSTTGISDLAADGRTVVSERFFNLSGAEVAEPVAGQRRSLYIVVKEFSDGTTAAVKEAR